MKSTIKDAAVKALTQSGKPMTANDIYNAIVSNGLYSFSGKNPLSILKIELQRQTEGIEVSRAKAEKFFTMVENAFWVKGVSIEPVKVEPVIIPLKSAVAPKGTFKTGDLEDLQAIERVKNGDNNAFGFIYKKYKEVLMRKIQQRVNFDNELAEDLLMEIFEKAFKKCVDFQKDYTFNSWLTRLADNHIIDYARKRKLETISLSGVGGESEEGEVCISEKYVKSDSKTPYEIQVLEENKGLVRKGIDSLDEMHKVVIELRYFQDKSYEEISEELNIGLSNVKIMLHRAKKKLLSAVQGYA